MGPWVWTEAQDKHRGISITTDVGYIALNVKPSCDLFHKTL